MPTLDLDDLVKRISELESAADDVESRDKLLSIVDGAMSIAKKEAAAKSEGAKREAANQAAILLEQMNARLREVEKDLLVAASRARGDADIDIPSEEEQEHVESAVDPLSSLLQMGIGRTGIAEALEKADIDEDKKKDIQAQLSKLPELTSDFIKSLPTMFTYDKTNLCKATLGMGAVAAGIAVLAVGLSATNPIGWVLLGGALLSFGIGLAARAIKEHKQVMKERAEKGEKVETVLDAAKDALAEKKKSFIQSMPGPAQSLAERAVGKAEELARNEGVKRLRAAVDRPN